MKKLSTILVGALALAATSLSAHAAPSEQEEQFALQAGAILMLAVENLEACDIGADIPALITMAEKASDVAGVKPTDYPQGEWLRKTFFFIASNRFYSAVQNHDPASVASFCKFLHEKVLPKIKDTK